MPEADQRRIGEIYISAFLDVVARGDKRYLPIFRDHRVIGQWLPKTMYITRFETNAFRPVATFEEDIDLTSGTESGVVIKGDSLATWREATLMLRSRNRPNTSASQDNQAVTLAWNNRIQGPDTTLHGPPARYTLELPSGLATDWNLSPATTLDFMLAPTNAIPSPRENHADAEDVENQRGVVADPGAGNQQRGGDAKDDDESRPPIDLTIELTDGVGQAASVVLSDYGAIRRPLEIRVLRRRDLDDPEAARASAAGGIIVPQDGSPKSARYSSATNSSPTTPRNTVLKPAA